MTIRPYDEKFIQAAEVLPNHIIEILMKLPKNIQENIQEIRLRANAPLMLTRYNEAVFVTRGSELRHTYTQNAVVTTRKDVEDTFNKICSYSVHAHQNDIKNGFVTITGGHRAGICGTAVMNSNEITGVKEISSINIRIARQVFGVATEIVKTVFQKGLCGVIIAGEPSSGKTTVLRDMANILIKGEILPIPKISIIDERGEIAAVSKGEPQNNLSVSCDILNGYPKTAGIIHAIRCLSPDLIICDELGTAAEANAIIEGLNAGVPIVTSLHANSFEELLRKPQMQPLLRSRSFEYAVLLSGKNEPSKCKKIYAREELYAQIDRTCGSDSFKYLFRKSSLPDFEREGKIA